jgi:transposase
LEIGEVQRFSSIEKAISYCGLCGDEQRSANSVQRTPISKQRNKHLQTTLIEAAKMAPRWKALPFFNVSVSLTPVHARRMAPPPTERVRQRILFTSIRKPYGRFAVYQDRAGSRDNSEDARLIVPSRKLVNTCAST